MIPDQKRDLPIWYTYIDITNCGHPIYAGKGDKCRIKNLKRNEKHTRYVEKYGINRVIFLEDVTEQEAINKEVELIRDFKLNSCRYPENYWACNFTDGGEGLSGHKFSVDHKRKLSEQKLGENNPMKRLESRLRNGDLKRGKKLSIDHCRKLSKSKRGMKLPPRSKEHCQKISLARKGMSSGDKNAMSHANIARRVFLNCFRDERLISMLKSILKDLSFTLRSLSSSSIKCILLLVVVGSIQESSYVYEHRTRYCYDQTTTMH